MRLARRRYEAPAPAIPASQRRLLRHYERVPQPLASLAAALGISTEMLRRELRGVRVMPEARQVALWYLLDGCY